MAALNYAKEYQQALEQEFPYVLYFGALFATPNNGRSRLSLQPDVWTETETQSVRRNVTTTTPGHHSR